MCACDGYHPDDRREEIIIETGYLNNTSSAQGCVESTLSFKLSVRQLSLRRVLKNQNSTQFICVLDHILLKFIVYNRKKEEMK